MIKYLLILFLLVGCSTKFRFNEKVEVVSGFYKGCTGNVGYHDGVFKYRVFFKTCPLTHVNTWNGDLFSSWELKSIEETK